MTIPQVLQLADERGKKFNKSGMGKAAGKYQFMPGTLEGFAKRLTPGSDDWKNIKYNADTQEMLMKMLMIY